MTYTANAYSGASEYELVKYQTTGGIAAEAGVTGRYTFSVTALEHTRAGYRELHVEHAIQGGLTATYYSGANFTEAPIDPYVWPNDGIPAKNAADSTVDFSQGANTASAVVQTWPGVPTCLVNALYPLQVTKKFTCAHYCMGVYVIYGVCVRLFTPTCLANALYFAGNKTKLATQCTHVMKVWVCEADVYMCGLVCPRAWSMLCTPCR
jgi:hypothetical protein